MVLENLAPPPRLMWWEKFLHRRPAWRYVVLTGLFVLALIYMFILRPPENFPVKKPIVIRSETTITQAAKIFADKEAIKIPRLYIDAVKVFSLGRGVQAGTYYFDRPINVLLLAWRTATGGFGLKKIKITIPEGATSFAITKALAAALPEFDNKEFLKLAEAEEGYLFPDTYLLLPYTPVDELIKVMTSNFDRAIGPYRGAIAARGRDIKEIVTLASIVEKEAATTADRKLIAGVMWNRLEKDMPLQVDAVFAYFTDKNTYELTKADLQHDSPYNTYKYKGLPPGPIGSPSLDAIGATLFPTESNYFYYLADRNGKTYYAETFEEHKKNRAKYLAQ